QKSQGRGPAGGLQPHPPKGRATGRFRVTFESEIDQRAAFLQAVTPMFLPLLSQSFRRQQRRKLLAGIALSLGVAVATAMIAVATDIGDKLNRELRSFGANLVVYPEED